MQHDRLITISAAGNRWAKVWQPQQLYVSELYAKLATPARGQETLVTYLRMSKAEQDSRKDVGGFVSGELSGGIRKNAAVRGRDVVTLDMDAVPAGGTDEVLRRCAGLSCGWASYSTRKHELGKPRLRVLIPLDRTVTADEYEPIARKLAELIEIGWCDPTTFQPVRMMYWPSVCSDGVYVYRYEDKPFASADGVLGLYRDWRDMASWPQVPGQKAAHAPAAKQEDPTTKPGVVGAWCRTYNVYQVMEQFLQGAYEPVDTGGSADGTPDRYTFTGGSTAGGAIVYDGGKYLFSHHATDPAGGRLVNSFDLTRLHLYGALDDEAKEGTPVARLPSYMAMRKRAIEDPEVSLLLSKERYDQTAEDFGPLEGKVEDVNWLTQLEKNPNTSAYEHTVNNIILILRHDPELRDKIAYDEFSVRCMVLDALPWNAHTPRRKWADADDNASYWYLEHRYKIGHEKNLERALDIVSRERSYNDVQAYFNSLEWDGVPRLDALFIDYLNAEDNEYTRTVTRKVFAAAVARAMQPGIKFDYSVILVGKQGKGKSTLLRIMGRDWFLEDLPPTLEGKEASERIQGYLLAEMGELNGLTKSEVNTAKAFLSRTTDVYRIPFDRHTQEFPRKCIIFGSTNEGEFLRDGTGNRRFWPVTLQDSPGTLNVFNDLPGNVDQLWAEAVLRWRLGEPLYLNSAMEEFAATQQARYRVENAKEGMIAEFLDRKLPKDWESRDMLARKMYWSNELQRADANMESFVERQYACAIELYCECFGQDKGRVKQTDTREINSILVSLPGWIPVGPRKDKVYGTQRSFGEKADYTCLHQV